MKIVDITASEWIIGVSARARISCLLGSATKIQDIGSRRYIRADHSHMWKAQESQDTGSRTEWKILEDSRPQKPYSDTNVNFIFYLTCTVVSQRTVIWSNPCDIRESRMVRWWVRVKGNWLTNKQTNKQTEYIWLHKEWFPIVMADCGMERNRRVSRTCRHGRWYVRTLEGGIKRHQGRDWVSSHNPRRTLRVRTHSERVGRLVYSTEKRVKVSVHHVLGANQRWRSFRALGRNVSCATEDLAWGWAHSAPSQLGNQP